MYGTQRQLRAFYALDYVDPGSSVSLDKSDSPDNFGSIVNSDSPGSSAIPTKARLKPAKTVDYCGSSIVYSLRDQYVAGAQPTPFHGQ
jgi:hypothetical protein